VPADRQLAMELVEHADVVMECFRPGVMSRLGFAYSDVVAVNPSVVYCSITGYGQAGARASSPGHDLNYQAVAGMLALGQAPGATPWDAALSGR
jgi:crotonobetainyl-CoA:carnitine CoA-transferase CaiB-like acyl-CoA transferase